MKFNGEIAYEGEGGRGVHSDIGASHLDDELRAFYHRCLDEWLDKSNGSGGFWLGDPNYFRGWGERGE